MPTLSPAPADCKTHRIQKPLQTDHAENRLGRAITAVVREAEAVGDRTTVLVALALRQAIADR